MVRQRWTKKEAEFQWILATFLQSDVGLRYVDVHHKSVIPSDQEILNLIRRWKEKQEKKNGKV